MGNATVLWGRPVLLAYGFTVDVQGACTAYIRYPPRIDPDDDTWLFAAVARYDGELSSLVMESFPAQRLARFKTVSAGLIEWNVSADATINRAHQHATNTTRPEQDTGGSVELQESAAGRG